MKLTILQKGLLIVLLSVVLQIICVGSLYFFNLELDKELIRQRHSAQIVHTAEALVGDIFFTSSATRMGRSFNAGEAVRAIQKVYPATKERLNLLRKLVADNPEELKIINQVEPPLTDMGDTIFRARDLARAGEFEEARRLLVKVADDSKIYSPRLADGVFTLLNKEKKIEEASPLIQEDFRKKIQIALVITLGLNIAIAIFLTVMFNKGLAQRLRKLSDNVIRLASNQPLGERLKGTDELAALDSAFRDMASALSDARENERALVENAREVICSLSADLRFSSVNQAIESLIGYEREQLLGTRFVSIVDPIDIEETLEYFERAKTSDSDKMLENRTLCKDGTTRNFEWSVRWSAEKQSYFCVAHDITEAKRIEQMKQEFVAMVSHDLRSPLASIQAFHECLDRGIYGDLNGDGAKTLHSVDESINRLLNLIGDLLDVEKLESGALSLHLESVLLDDVFQQSKFSVEELARKKEIKLTCSGGGVTVTADSERLVQVLVNLLSNAIKFSSEKTDVEMLAEKQDGQVLIQVVDHGRGIPAEQVATVFDRFKQVEPGDSKNRQGSGLGLAICKAIVEQHHGEIGVRSKVDEGSTFWFTLPCV
ncbi:MAG TPA: ATP-binding protein [Drouetiella sp.]